MSEFKGPVVGSGVRRNSLRASMRWFNDQPLFSMFSAIFSANIYTELCG
jgi:hypothetical protein